MLGLVRERHVWRDPVIDGVVAEGGEEVLVGDRVVDALVFVVAESVFLVFGDQFWEYVFHLLF